MFELKNKIKELSWKDWIIIVPNFIMIKIGLFLLLKTILEVFI